MQFITRVYDHDDVVYIVFAFTFRLRHVSV